MATEPTSRPNILFVMTDQQRFDTIAALGNEIISTPALDRLVNRGATFTKAYATCPVCVPSRYTIMSGCEPTRTDIWDNEVPAGQHDRIAATHGDYLPATLRDLGYRTWGIGKFHTTPWDADLGFERQIYSEELYEDAAQRERDAYAAWVAQNRPGSAWVEALHGERTEMYYMPQISPLPAEDTVESWATDRALDELADDDARPWFGFLSYIGPHPPFAPPLPYNRGYDPESMPDPIVGDIAVDHLDQHIPWMNHAVYAEDVDPVRARALRARYYGEISYIDACIGRLLDAVEARPDAANTVICFFSDHGDLLGDHNGWQKESFFEASTRVPFLVSWPARIPRGVRHDGMVALTDLFAIATTAAGDGSLRQGVDVLGMLADGMPGRDELFGFHGGPGTERFKAMVREGRHKLIWMSNGGRRLLFDVDADPHELSPIGDDVIADRLEQALHDQLRREGLHAAFEGDQLKVHPYRVWPLERIQQFERGRGVTGYAVPGRTALDDSESDPE